MSKVLIDAIGLCDVDLVRKILLNDNIKIFNKKKDALIEASLRGYEEIVDVLLKDSRCDPNNKGCYALLCAMKGLQSILWQFYNANFLLYSYYQTILLVF